MVIRCRRWMKKTIIDPKKRRENLVRAAPHRKTEINQHIVWLMSPPGTFVFFWPFRWVQHCLRCEFYLAFSVSILCDIAKIDILVVTNSKCLYINIEGKTLKHFSQSINPLLSCAALPDGVWWDPVDPSHSLWGAVSAARQPDPESPRQHHLPRLWPVHPAAGHLWHQVSMVALINSTPHHSDRQGGQVHAHWDCWKAEKVVWSLLLLLCKFDTLIS